MDKFIIEEKTNRYDIAVELAAKFKKEYLNYKVLNVHKGVIEAFNNIFPELKESEDEKIRKALIRFHKSSIDIDGIKGNDILAWLEKQDEKKPIEEVNGEDYGIDGLWHAQRILENTLGSVDGYQTDDGILDHKAAITAVKKLYKQKHSLSEEDEHRIKLLEALCEDKLSESVPNSTMYEEMKITIDWLNFLRPQPKQEWSEEDQNALEDVREAVVHYWGGETQDILLYWLKSLKQRIKGE